MHSYISKPAADHLPWKGTFKNHEEMSHADQLQGPVFME